jgi:hypothetical protein
MLPVGLLTVLTMTLQHQKILAATHTQVQTNQVNQKIPTTFVNARHFSQYCARE